jgi:hypothetical protein
MSQHKPRLSQLASRMGMKSDNSPGNKKPLASDRKPAGVDPNPPHGERGEFRKVTVTLPPAVYEMLVAESFRRKMAREPNHLLASIVRESVVSHLTRPQPATSV